MNPDRSNWRSSSAYEYLDDLTAPEIGWECLRRNSDYQRDYQVLEGGPPAADELRDQLSRRWGLRFPDRAGAFGLAGRDLLAA